MRHGWRSSSSGVRTPVRLSVQGPPGEVPATAPFSIPLHHRHRRWPGGVSRPRIFIHVHETLAHKNVATDTAHLQQRPPSLVPPAAGRRISSSYSSSACLRKRNRTRVSRAAAGCAAAAVRRQKPPVRAPTTTKHPEHVWGDGQTSMLSPVTGATLTQHVGCPTACLNLQLEDHRYVCAADE